LNARVTRVHSSDNTKGSPLVLGGPREREETTSWLLPDRNHRRRAAMAIRIFLEKELVAKGSYVKERESTK
jgi:hypothetical protein